MKVARGSNGDVIVTHALGSCLGIVVHDPVAHVAGLLHVMLPNAAVSPDKAKANPFMFVDTGVPLLFREAYAAGAEKGRLIVKVAGGAVLGDKQDFFAIGKRNYIMLRKLTWANGVMIAAEDVGGHICRTVSVEVASGRTVLHSAGREWEL